MFHDAVLHLVQKSQNLFQHETWLLGKQCSTGFNWLGRSSIESRCREFWWVYMDITLQIWEKNTTNIVKESSTVRRFWLVWITCFKSIFIITDQQTECWWKKFIHFFFNNMAFENLYILSGTIHSDDKIQSFKAYQIRVVTAVILMYIWLEAVSVWKEQRWWQYCCLWEVRV